METTTARLHYYHRKQKFEHADLPVFRFFTLELTPCGNETWMDCYVTMKLLGIVAGCGWEELVALWKYYYYYYYYSINGLAGMHDRWIGS